MWKYFLLHLFLWVSSLQFQLHDLLSSTDKFFEEFYVTDGRHLDSEVLKLMLKRTYDLDDEHRITKRATEQGKLIQDEHGVYMLSNVQDMNKIPVKFPEDINIFSYHNLLYITALEANGTNPENQLANDLVLYHYSSIQGIKELVRVPVLGGTKIAVHIFQNTTYLIAAEYEAKENPDYYQGSVIYRVVESNKKVFLEKIQILNVVQPNDLTFWEHQDQLYLVIGTNMGDNSERTGTLIYRWLGFHFDCLQVIPTKNVKSVTPFRIGSFMYLAVANFQDEHGNFDISSEIFQFNLQEMKFKPFQKIKTHGARNIAHFNFEDTKSRESEHFLIVANTLGKNSDGNITSLKESVVYKFSDNYFIPFQSFKLKGITQWLPIKGPSNEFLLLASHANGVEGYQYDGWRFTSISFKFRPKFFGNNIRSMRAFSYFGDLFLTIADKSSYGNNINLWKLSFTKRNYLGGHYKDVETWCNEMNKNISKDHFNEVLKKFSSLFDSNPEQSEPKLKAENHLAGDFSREMRNELELLGEKTKNLEDLLRKAEEDVEKFKSESELPIVLGSQELASLELTCKTRNCCQFKKVNILKMNDENFTDFLANVVPLSEGLSNPVLEFEHVVLETDLSSPMVNGRPSETLIDLSSNTLINADLIVNGTVFINNDLKVDGLFDGDVPDAEHLLLSRGFQNIQDVVLVNNLRVENLKLTGHLNGEPIESLLRKPDITLPNDYKELNVNNMFVEGLVGGYNLTELFAKAPKNTGNLEIHGNLNIESLVANDVRVDSNEISKVNISKIFDALEERNCQPDPNSDAENNFLESDQLKMRSVPEPHSDKSHNENSADEYVIIVEGVLKAKDLSDENNSTSILHIRQNSLELNDSVIDSNFQFSDIVVEDFDVDIINDVPLSSWILKSSNSVQHVRGKKMFSDDVHIVEEVHVDKMNDIDLEKLERDVLRLEGDQIIRADVKFRTVKCHEAKANFMNFGRNSFDSLNRLELRDSVLADRLEVENLTISGDIDSMSWENLMEDFVYEKDIVLGRKMLNGSLRAENLNISGRINDLFFEQFVTLTSSDANKIVLDKNVTLKGPLNVDELHFEGLLDFTLNPNFEREWLLQDETQIITGPVTFENVFMKSGSNLMNETINNIDLRKLFARSMKINEDTKIKHLFALGRVKTERLDIKGTLNGADFEESILRSKSTNPQTLTGDWFFGHGLSINGSFVVEGHLSGLNLSHLCGLNPTGKVNLIVGGSVNLQQEPVIVSKVNELDLSEKAKEVWMRNEPITLRGRNLRFGDVEFDNKTTLLGLLNNVNLTNLSKFYLSKSQPRVISEDFEFDALVMKKRCRMRKATVGGLVNGLNLSQWAKNVLLQEEDQIIEETHWFQKFQIKNLQTEGTVNGFNLAKDVLRLDVEDAVVEGETTFRAINVQNLTLAKGKRLQGVDMDAWRENSIKTTEDVIIKGDLTLENATFNGPFKVTGKVNNIYFDSQHLLTIAGNQVVSASKYFDYGDREGAGMKIKYFEVSGMINGVDVNSLMKNQAYSDRSLVFEEPKTFTRGLETTSMEVEGLFHGVNVSGMCDDVFNPIDVNVQKNDLMSLLNQTKALIRMVKDRAFFFDYFEVIQTLKPNIKAVVPTLDSKGNYLLAIFVPNKMIFMDWNEYTRTFVNRDEELDLADNVTFVASEVTENRSFLYIETEKSAKIFEPKLLKEIETTDTSCIVSFQLRPLNKSCIFIGQKWNSSRILCNSVLTNDLQTYQWLESKGSVQVAALTIEDETFIATINKEIIFDRIENTLTIYRFDPKLQHFYVSHTLAEINPVALSSVSYKNDHYLVSAGGHLPESVHNSVVSIFRFNRRHKVFVRAQSIQVGTPVDVHFAILPSSQLALYVLTSNPTKPFVVFLHKGISGFVQETSGLSLYPGSYLYSFTDSRNQHFAIISGFGRGQILKAGFKGERAAEFVMSTQDGGSSRVPLAQKVLTRSQHFSARSDPSTAMCITFGLSVATVFSI